MTSDPMPTGGRGRRPRARIEPSAFIAANTRLLPVPSLPGILLHTAHEATGLWRLASAEEGGDPPPPYWAFPWAGGLALARYLLEQPKVVSGRRVLDLGTGSGLVAIAAAKAGAARVIAADIDRFAVAAARLNAAANAVTIDVMQGDLTAGPCPEVDVVAVGDLFYERDLAERVAAFLERCAAAGASVLVGDPGRSHLPRRRLRLIAEHVVPDVGDVEGRTTRPSAVFAFEPASGSASGQPVAATSGPG